MSKTFDELATEITIAWISSFGNAANGNAAFILQYVTEDKVSQFYKTVYRALIEASRHHEK
ncbi:MAG: hypothetical protein HPY52_10830 [Firmicutes bacterium]|nr:hypothetical protein [Bacillota bacterium]